MVTNGRVPSISARETAVGRGRIAYHAERHKHAIAYFSKAINSCPCSKSQSGGGDGSLREKCTCKRYEDGAKGGRAYDLVDEIMRPCTCEASGRVLSRCDDPIHNQALGYRAACYEELGKLDLARRDAEWTLELYPLRLEAYLRFGKVARRQGKPVLAWQVYSAGVQVGRRHGLADDAMFRKLIDVRSVLHRKLCRLDPLGLPIEIVEQIFSYFDTKELCLCLPVSKSWHMTLSSRSFLWRNVSFEPRARAVPSLNSVRRIVKYSGNDMRSLTITNTNRFKLEPKFAALLTGSRNMTDLRLHGFPVNCGESLQRASWPLCNLTHLTLTSHMFQRSSAPGPSDTNRTLTDILCRNADHIEFISLTSDHINFGTSWPTMKKLKHLKIAEFSKDTLPNTSRHRQTMNLPDLWTKAPNLEQLWLDVFRLESANPPDEQSAVVPNPVRLPRLRSLVVGPRVYWPCVGAPVDELVFLHRVGDLAEGVTGYGNFGVEEEVMHMNGAPDSALRKARHIYLPRFSPDIVYDTPPKASLRQGIEAALKEGTLRTLALVIYSRTHDKNYISTMDWLRGSPSIRKLALYIRLEPFRYPTNGAGPDAHPPVLTSARSIGDFVGAFPNLETLEVVNYEGLSSGAIIEASVGDGGPIKTVYQEGISGQPFDTLKEYLAAKSVQLLYGRMPDPVFPIKLE